ncbi:MAG: LicD family protein [Bacteroidales bacterium]|jgi:GR25 family glycosyltransferase involved in LPS biosynthesis|nr:LicD family protein [Bacteroidales bacterium]
MQIYQIILPENVASKCAINMLGDMLDITEVKHVDFSDLNIYSASYKEKYGFDLSHGEINNFSSHRKAWTQFMETSLSWCLIVESNVSLSLSVKDLIGTVGELPVGWELFFPYDRQLYIQKQANGKTLINRNAWEYEKTEPYLLKYKHGNSIYLLSRSGAEKLLKIDTIIDRLDHTILKMTEDENALSVYSSDVDWLDQSDIRDYEWPDRCRSLLNLAAGQSSWTDLSLSRMRNLLKIISDIGMQKNIDLVLDAGTLLAYIRHGGMMLWDDDIDIGIEKKDLPVLFEEIGKHRNLRYADGFKFQGTPYYKIWDTEGEEIKGYPYTFPFIDLWAFKKNGNDILYENRNRYPDAAMHDCKKIIFEGVAYKIPWNALEVLDSRYTDWRSMIRVYTWCHREEKNNFKYLYIPVKTDENGRMKEF